MIFLSMMLITTLLSSTVLFTYLYFRYHRPSRGRREADRLALDRHLDGTVGDLRPWGPEALTLLGAAAFPLSRKLGWKDRHSGVLKTIYDEAVVAWAYLHYKSKSPHYLLVFRISGEDQPFALSIRDGRAFLFEGDRHVASIEMDGSWTEPRSGRVIGQLRHEPGESRALTMGDRMAAILQFPPKADHPKPRLFQWLEPLDSDQARWARIIGVCWLIVQQERIPLSL